MTCRVCEPWTASRSWSDRLLYVAWTCDVKMIANLLHNRVRPAKERTPIVFFLVIGQVVPAKRSQRTQTHLNHRLWHLHLR